jgi:hypothetical protein
VRRLLPALLLVALAAASAAAAATLRPAQLVVTAHEVGSGYLRVQFSGEQSLQTPTLDMCHLSFPSEKLRLARAHVTFQRGQQDPTVTNEVVLYKQGGAAEAMREIRAGVSRCPKGPVVVGNVSLTTQITPIKLKGSFLKGAIALSFHEFGTVKNQPVAQDGTVLYQSRGNLLSATFAYTKDPPTRAKYVTRVGEASAKKLAAA